MILWQKPWLVSLLAFALLLATFVDTRFAQAATISIINNDGPSEGFNDPTPVSPVGGNSGTTLGMQRLIAFQFAADIWGDLLNSPVEIRVDAQFNPLACDATSATLGFAGTTTLHAGFTGALVANTWYSQALANSLAGSDLAPASDDISATFNSVLDLGNPDCLGRIRGYYGLDANPPSGTLDFVGTMKHELAHGLGFLTVVDLATGAKLMDMDDVYMLNLEDHSTGQRYPDMTNAERVTASTDTGDLHWVGPNAVAASGFLTEGRHPSGHVEMYAPNPQEPGSSVGHFSDDLFPNELMEPFASSLILDVGLALELFQDTGWRLRPVSGPTGVLENPPPGSFQSGIGVISGFVCEATQILIAFNGTASFEAAYGTSRGDTQSVCGDANNGFGLLFNWNLLGDGIHTVRALADGVEFARVTVTVITLGLGEFPAGLSGEYSLMDFPGTGDETIVQWQQSQQNFVIISGAGGGGGSAGGPPRVLENPQPSSFQSGIGVISGFVCDASQILIEFDGTSTFEAAYGTSRGDTQGVCGDTNNGFSLLFNWNLLDDGTHTVRAFADGVLFAEVTITVTTLGLGEFPTGLSGSYDLPIFPGAGDTTSIEWQQSQQNFRITRVDDGSEGTFPNVAGTWTVTAAFDSETCVFLSPSDFPPGLQDTVTVNQNGGDLSGTIGSMPFTGTVEENGDFAISSDPVVSTAAGCTSSITTVITGNFLDQEAAVIFRVDEVSGNCAVLALPCEISLDGSIVQDKIGSGEQGLAIRNIIEGVQRGLATP